MKKAAAVVVGASVLLVVVVVLALAISGGIWWYWTRTPQYSIRQVRRAIESHDLVLFQKHVDLDSVVGSFVDATLAAQREAPPANAWEQAGRNLGQGLVLLIKPRLVQEIKAKIIEGVEKPVVGQRPVNYVATEKIDVQGKQATATLRFTTTSGPLIVKLRMRSLGSHWQIAEIVNAAELTEKRDLLQR